jgi:hypothetical protein
MTGDTIGITKFVRGMVWHDIGKPFHLGTGGHIWLGYWLLREAGCSGESLLALAHGGGNWDNLKGALKPYFEEQHTPNTLPAMLILANPLDRLSASVYSLLSRRFERQNFLDEKTPLFHAWQNPFSRLPMYSNDLERRFIVRESYDNAQVPHRRDEQLDNPSRDRLIDVLPDGWDQYIDRELLDNATRADTALEAASQENANGQALIQTLLRFQAQYPERTHLPANDTTLQEHCRLGGALAFVLHRNLEQTQSAWLTRRMWLEKGKGGNKYRLGFPDGPNTADEIHTYLKDKNGWTEAQRVACSHLDASLVRIAFEGQRELFENAVRVDDLLGARALTERFLDRFEEQLAHVLGVEDLMWSSEGDNRQCLLTLHRSQFDLFYVLPPHPTGDSVTTIEEAVHSAYEGALEKIVDKLLEDLEEDFGKAVGDGELSFDDEAEEALCDQLRALSYRVRILDLDVAPAYEVDTFADFTSEYGTALVNNFSDSREYPIVPAADLPFQAESEEDVQLPADKTCDVCGNHPILEPFVELLDDEKWKPYVQKVAHHFREEPERPCISCIARRILSHGAVSRETPGLEEMVTWDDEIDPPCKLRARLPDEIKDLQTEQGMKIPNPPPSLVTSVEFEDDDDFLDLGAAYARYRRGGTGKLLYDEPPELFPTIGYAADANSNVILLALQPTSMLDKTYNYTCSAYAIGNPQRKVKKGFRRPEDDKGRWQASVALIYRWVQANQGEDLAKNMIAIKPHLARVLERIRHIRDFYRTLKVELEAEPMRVLPLDVNFPTLRLLLPADQLDQALHVLDRVVTESLFSATHYEDWEDRREAHEQILKLIVPDLLHGAVVLFKQKFPLYLALEAERDVFHQLAISDPKEPPDKRCYPSNSQWYGFRLGFSDLRSSLSEVGPIQAEVAYADLGEVLELADPMKGVDRRTVLQHKATADYISPELAEARTWVRTRRVGTFRPEQAEALSETSLFPPVHFIKRAIRR